MSTGSTPANAILALSKVRLKWRIVFAIFVLVVDAVIDILMVHYGSRPTFVFDFFIFILAVVVVFRPRWIDRWNEKEREQIEKSDPDLRQWM